MSISRLCFFSEILLAAPRGVKELQAQDPLRNPSFCPEFSSSAVLEPIRKTSTPGPRRRHFPGHLP